MTRLAVRISVALMVAMVIGPAPAGTEVTIIDGAGLDRVFHVDPGQNGLQVELRNLTVRGGSVTGDNGGGLRRRGRHDRPRPANCPEECGR